MKKIMTFVLLCFIFLLFGKLNSNAGQYDSLPKGKNYLSLSNILLLESPDYYAQTIEPIRVKNNTIYTLVFDFDYLGQLTMDLSSVFIEIEEDSGVNHSNYIIEDRQNERAYFEFTTSDEWIHIAYMPNGHTNGYNAMLYEGTYQDFNGFIPYINSSEIMNYQGLIPMDYDHLLTIDQIKSYVTAYNSQGHAIAYDVISDSYSASSKLPGAYQMTFQVTHNLITKKYILDIRIFDLTGPIISIPNLIEIPLAEKIDVNQIKSLLEVTDNVDIMDSANLSILNDTYTSATTVGIYYVLFEASDQSGNKSTLEVPITLVDKKGPVISGPQMIYLYTTDAPLSNSSILSKYKAVDDVDGNVSVSISYNLYNQTLTPGIYQMAISSSDAQLNTTNKNITIHVIENKGPIFETNEKIIEKSVADTMTDAEIIAWFKAQLELSGIQATNLNILFSEYKDNEKQSGSYYVYLSYESNGLTEITRVRIDVVEDENMIPFTLYISIASGLLIAGLGITYYVKKKRI
ncbi:MAG: hypothetical protein CVV57_00400 [Tenericutes bacterium HGW-Tenericutes-2]|jgi:hypothetical protein|nr:MAG: hypothetical protein CVV57_00400 [Tenericutes bacterium HGW-Tenericutes-2]